MPNELSPLMPRPRVPAAVADVLDAWLAGRTATTRRGYLSDLEKFAA
jgi:hypothetical protein